MESLRLSKSDNTGVRHGIPSLMICLDQDQECYNFVKWWALSSWRGERWGDSSVKSADPLESPDWYYTIHGFILAHAVSVTLLKIKLMFVFMSQLGEGKDNSVSAIEAMASVQGSSFMRNPEITNCQDKPAAIEKVKDHIRQLYAIVHRRNRHFWSELVESDEHPGNAGDEEERWDLNYTYDSWENFKPAIEIIARALRGEMI